MKAPEKRIGFEAVEREYYVDVDPGESMLGKLTGRQIKRLGDIVDEENPELIRRSEDLILYIICPKTIPNKQRADFLDDARRVYKALSKCKPAFLNWVDQGSIYDSDSPTQTVLEMAQHASNANKESASLRGDVGILALKVFDDLKLFEELGIEIGTSSTGSFANYLSFISDVSGFTFDAHDLARKTLKNR